VATSAARTSVYAQARRAADGGTRKSGTGVD